MQPHKKAPRMTGGDRCEELLVSVPQCPLGAALCYPLVSGSSCAAGARWPELAPRLRLSTQQTRPQSSEGCLGLLLVLMIDCVELNVDTCRRSRCLDFPCVLTATSGH